MSGRSDERTAAPASAAVLALAVVLAITVAWWALALWPLSAAAPGWLLRTRALCFGASESSLPDAAGWIALIVQPALMLGVLVVSWGRSLAAGLGTLAGRRAGRVVLGLAVSALTVAVTAAGWRVSEAMAREDALALAPSHGNAGSYTRAGEAAPHFALIDQHGRTVSLDRFRGRPVIVAFAFAHCASVCPLVVQQALQAQAALPEPRPALVVITLDPWRDTPARLPYIAQKWGVGPGNHVLSGSVAEVNRVLDEWKVARSRDASTGDVAHAALIYLVDSHGSIAYRVSADASLVAELVRGL